MTDDALSLSTNLDHEFDEVSLDLERLCSIVHGMISAALTSEGIQFLHIQSRVKDRSSFQEKVQRKGYRQLDECTDLVGARIILFLESEIAIAQDVMRRLFQEDEKNSVDHMKKEVNTVGYNSLHLVCTLGDKRSAFLEYKDITNIAFEVQIRTALQHAWAEIEHKQKYKAENALPPSLQRRLALVSASLESIDREFSEIVDMAQNYENHVKNGLRSLDKDGITSAALVGLYFLGVERFDLSAINELGNERRQSEALPQLMKACGFDTVASARQLVLSASVDEVRMYFTRFGSVFCDRLFKVLLVLSSCDRYLEVATAFGVNHINRSSLEFYEQSFPTLGLREKIASYDIKVIENK